MNRVDETMKYVEKFQIVVDDKDDGSMQIITVDEVSEYNSLEEAERKCKELQQISILSGCRVIRFLESVLKYRIYQCVSESKLLVLSGGQSEWDYYTAKEIAREEWEKDPFSGYRLELVHTDSESNEP